jgi:probable HAF family extracellular repeat protein
MHHSAARLLVLLAAAASFSPLLRADNAQYYPTIVYENLSVKGLVLGGNDTLKLYGITGNSTSTACFASIPINPPPKSLPSLIKLPLPKGDSQGSLAGAGSSGRAVGFCVDKNGQTQSIAWTPSGSSSWIVTTLDTFPNTYVSLVGAVNATGEAVGTGLINTNGETGVISSEAVSWNASGVGTILNNVDNNSTLILVQATAINDAGQIVGQAAVLKQAAFPFLLDNGVVTDLGDFNGTDGVAMDINNSGQITGYYYYSGTNPHAFLYTNGTMTDLGTLPNGKSSWAYAINDAGLVVGFATVANGTGHAVYWDTNGTIHDLNTVAPSANYTYDEASAVDSAGDIGVQAHDKSQNQYGIVLILTSDGPVIMANPVNYTAPVGGMASFSVTANGTATLKYQWSLTANGTTKNISGATKSTYTITKVAATNAGKYAATVSNSYGSVTSKTATLTVDIPPKISTQPKALTVTAGGYANFTVALASGATPPVTYHWQYANTTVFANITGAIAPNYTINAATTTNAGSYRVQVTGSGVTVTSSTAKLTVKAVKNS